MADKPPPNAKKTRITKNAIEQAKAELEHSTRIHNVAQLHQTIRFGLSVICISVCAYAAYLCIREMAGKSTDFKSVINWAVSWSVSEYVAMAIATVVSGAWWVERRRNRKVLAGTRPRMAELEKAVHPDRTSSGMNQDGTEPEAAES